MSRLNSSSINSRSGTSFVFICFAPSSRSLLLSFSAYSLRYSVSLALRYIPDIQNDYHEIAQSQEARGVALGKDVKFTERLKNSAKILLPLVLTSLNRIDEISNSMQLRSFGKMKKRTWYMQKKMTAADYGVIAFCVVLFAVGLIITNQGGNNLYNPFVR